MAELNVNPGDLVRVADAYGELAARSAQISPLAAAEVQRIAETHGPMGYPTAVGIAAGLAAREAPLQAKVADFITYARRFTEHAAAYTTTDAEGGQRIRSVDFAADLREDGLLPGAGGGEVGLGEGSRAYGSAGAHPVQSVGFTLGGAPPTADTGFTAPDGTRAPAEGGPLTGVLARSDLGGNGESGMTDIGLADLYAHDVAPNIATRHVLPPDNPIDRWENPGWHTPPGSISMAPGTEPKPPGPGH